MKIIFFISASQQSKGGHYYSLLETANLLNKKCDILIISIGIKKSPVLEEYKGRYLHINEGSIINTFQALVKILKNEKADIYHAFDSTVFFYVRNLSFFYKIPNVLTKCGGANAKNYPVCDNLILYSIENFEYYKNKKNYSKTKINFIPNRVSKPDQNYQRINKLKEKILKNIPVMLRITRINSVYEQSIFQTINLVKLLNKNQLNLQFILIGSVHDKHIYQKLKLHECKYIKFIVDEEYHINSSQLIDIADIVVGTGRGFMEASSMGKIMLAPTANLEIPVLVNEDNFLDIFKYNFSPRYKSNKDTNQILYEITECLKNEDKSNIFIKKMALEYFMVDTVAEKYISIYKGSRRPRLLLLNNLKHLIIKMITQKHNRQSKKTKK